MKHLFLTITILSAFSAKAAIKEKLTFEEPITINKVYVKKELTTQLLKSYQKTLDKQFVKNNDRLIAKK
jgi:phage FluMu protein Com